MENFQKTYQLQLKHYDRDVDELLMLWKTAGGMNLNVEICGKGIVLYMFFNDFSTVCWNNVEKWLMETIIVKC